MPCMKKASTPKIIAPHMGSITTEEGEELFVDGTLSGTPSVLFDSVIVPEGEQSLTTLLKDGDAKYHCARPTGT